MAGHGSHKDIRIQVYSNETQCPAPVRSVSMLEMVATFDEARKLLVRRKDWAPLRYRWAIGSCLIPVMSND